LNKNTTFSSFAACVDDIVSEKWKPKDTAAIDYIKEFSKKPNFKDVVQFNAFFSSEYGCSGFCKKPLFAYATPITSGLPKALC